MAAQGKRPIAEQLAEYEDFLRGKGNTERHTRGTPAMLKRAVAACRWQAAADVDCTRALVFLNAIKARGRHARSFNASRIALRGFSRWLWTQGRLSSDPLVGLPRQNESADRVRMRRALSDDEPRRLILAAEHGPPVAGLRGQDRAALCRIAMASGFRRGELASLAPES